jgi:hypothetical protein
MEDPKLLHYQPQLVLNLCYSVISYDTEGSHRNSFLYIDKDTSATHWYNFSIWKVEVHFEFSNFGEDSW